MKQFWSQFHVIPALVSFFTLFDHFFFFFLAFDLFLGATTKGWKESIGFSDAEVFAKTFCIKKIKCSRTSPDPDFLDTCGQLKKTKIGRFEAEELAVFREKMFHYLRRKKKDKKKSIEKSPYIVSYW